MKKIYCTPVTDTIEIHPEQILAGSGVVSDDDVFNIDYGGVDEDGSSDPS